jgi:hypothetical protein
VFFLYLRKSILPMYFEISHSVMTLKWRLTRSVITTKRLYDHWLLLLDSRLAYTRTITVKNGIFKKILILQIKTLDLSNWNWENTVEKNAYIACFVTNRDFWGVPIHSIFDKKIKHLNVKLFIFEIPICILKVSSAVAELPTSVDAPPPPTFRLLGKYIRHLVFPN